MTVKNQGYHMLMMQKVLLGGTFLLIMLVWLYCPLFKAFPEPTGRFAVGSRSFHYMDESRSDQRQPSTRREVGVTLFYPSSAEKGHRFPYQEDTIKALIELKARSSYVPHFLWSLLFSGITSFAQPDAPIALQEAPYPLIIFLPGIGGEPLDNVYLEELASHGYIVAALAIPFDTAVTVLDGRIIGLDPDLASAIKKVDREAIYAYRTAAHHAWLGDCDLLLTKLEELDSQASSPFFKTVDWERLGVLGSSHGGGVAIDFCKLNKRCKAGVDMDGWTKTVNTTEGYTKPFLFLLSEGGLGDDIQTLANHMPLAHVKTISGAQHNSFGDYIQLKQPFAWYFGVTTGNPDRVRREIAQTLVKFFDSSLKKPSSSACYKKEA